jgi:hypothetical protein
VADAAAPILDGQPVAAALGLQAERGAWQNSPIWQARLQARSRALQELWQYTDPGTDAQRARQLITWSDAWTALSRDRLTGAQARAALSGIPAVAHDALDDLIGCGLRVPDSRQLQRVIRGGSHGAPDPVARGSIGSKRRTVRPRDQNHEL